MVRPSAEIRANVIVTHPVNEEMRAAYLRHLSGAANVTFFADLPDLDKASLLQVADVVSCSVLVKELSPEQLAALGRVRFIQALTSGIEWMPFDKLPSATVVANNAGVSSPAIAEHGMALALACAKHLLPNHQKLGTGVWGQQKPIRLLRNRVCGILGFGSIGRELGRLAGALGMQVFALNRSGCSTDEPDFLGTLADLEHVLRSSDVLFVSAPLNSETKGLIGSRELKLMKPDAILVNVSRAQIIDERALFEHLRTHSDFFAGLDVWWSEPWGGGEFRLSYPFFDLPNVIGSPHNSAMVEGFIVRRAEAAAENILHFLRGREPLNVRRAS